MGSSLRTSIPRRSSIMKFLIGLLLVAVATSAPLEHTPEVAEAAAMHLKAYAAAVAGEHSQLAPVQGPALYIADTPEVAAAKPYLPDTEEVAAAKPYLPDTDEVAAAKPYLSDTEEVAAAKPYLLDDPDVAAAKPYLPDTPDVAEAKVAFQTYFDEVAAGAVAEHAAVAEAQAAYQKYFDAVAAAAPPTPMAESVAEYDDVDDVAVAGDDKMLVPVAVASVPATYYSGYLPHMGYNTLGYAYAGHPYPYVGYAGLPYWLGAPVVAAPAAEPVAEPTAEVAEED